MDFVERMNCVMEYVEECLGDELCPEKVARIMACPFSVFQRSFVQITGIPVSEYLRRRRLTCAAYDLANTQEKVIDIALKYGYGSPDAFAAAFKRMHGLSPAAAREPGAKLAFYCRLSFALTMKGVNKLDYQLKEMQGFKVIGKRLTTSYGGGTWAIVKSDGSAQRLQEIGCHFYDLGLCFGFLQDGSNDYMCAVTWAGEDVPGFDSYTYPASSWLIFEAVGSITGQALAQTWQRINNEFLPQSKYQKSGLPTIEKYTLWNEKADECCVEIWVPVVEK